MVLESWIEGIVLGGAYPLKIRAYTQYREWGQSPKLFLFLSLLLYYLFYISARIL